MTASLADARPPGEPGQWSAPEWMRLQLAVLYRFDDAGRIAARRAPQAGPPPRFHLGRTPLGAVWCFGAGEPDAVVSELARLAAREAPLPAVPARGEPPEPERAEPMRRALGRDARALSCWRGPAFCFPERLEVPACPAELVELRPGEGRGLAPAFGDAPDERERCGPCVVAVWEGAIVARCQVAAGDARIAAEASLDTLPGHRRRGLGRAVTAAWARCVRERGGVPLYSTSWANRASRAVAASLGLVGYGEDLHWTPEPLHRGY